MSDGDDESRTEEPTEKKTNDAYERGDMPVSRDAAVASSIIAMIVAGAVVQADRSRAILFDLIALLDHAGDVRLRSSGDWTDLIRAIGGESVAFLGPPAAVLVFASLAAAFLQNRPRFVASRITPDWTRLSPAKGFARLFSRRGLVEFAKAGAKLALVGASAWIALQAAFRSIVDMATQDPVLAPSAIQSFVLRLVATIAVVAAFVALADVAATRFSWRKRLRMTRQELKDEMRQNDGDPAVKGRLRSLARDRARRRMIEDVQRATLVLVNPTHYAVALRYVREEGGAPVVVAKGRELIALKIRERAEMEQIPVVENPPLVRAMYDAVEINQLIPPEFYRAIAEIISVISRRASA